MERIAKQENKHNESKSRPLGGVWYDHRRFIEIVMVGDGNFKKLLTTRVFVHSAAV